MPAILFHAFPLPFLHQLPPLLFHSPLTPHFLEFFPTFATDLPCNVQIYVLDTYIVKSDARRTADAGTRARGDVAPCTVALAQPGAGVLSSEAELRTQISQRVSVCASRQQKLRMFTSLPTSHSTVTVTK